MTYKWISILKCPITGNDLRTLNDKDLLKLGRAVESHCLWQIDGKLITTTIESGLITINGQYIYPIINGICVMLKELAIVDDQDNFFSFEIDPDKQLVQNFYDQQGWFLDKDGNYVDAVIYEDLRDVSKDYIKNCNERVSRYLNPSGTYLLDAASGAIQFKDYLHYSANYTYRVCVDFSFQALKEAQKKVGMKGIYILADITNMPFKNNTMDGFLSLHTIYHIPKDQQIDAINELYRLLIPGGKGVVVYDWFKHSSWMNLWMLPFRGFVFIKNRTLSAINRLFGEKAPQKRLYFYAHPPQHFLDKLPPNKLKVWRSLSVPFMRYYIHPRLCGKKILNWIYRKEEKDPELCGLKGEYPMFVFEKK